MSDNYTRAEVAEIVEEALRLIGGAWDDGNGAGLGGWLAADANPQPHTITREELAEAVGILEGEQEEGALGTDALYQALIHLRIEVTDDE